MLNIIRHMEDTQRTETSHVAVDKKSTEIPLVAASETGTAQTPSTVFIKNMNSFYKIRRMLL